MRRSLKKSLRKRSLTKTVWKRAFRACEKAMIAAVNRRDKVCQLCFGNMCGNLVLQADHAIVSRKHLSTFFEIRQMVLLGAACHTNKTFKNFGTEIKVTEIIRKREGSAFINWLVQESRKVKKWSVKELEDLTVHFNNFESSWKENT